MMPWYFGLLFCEGAGRMHGTQAQIRWLWLFAGGVKAEVREGTTSWCLSSLSRRQLEQMLGKGFWLVPP